jgi:hypothetical protein
MDEADNKSSTPEHDAWLIEEAHADIVKTAKRILGYCREFRMPQPIIRFEGGEVFQLEVSPRISRAIKEDISGSVREYDRQIKHAETELLRVLVNETKRRMRKNGERPTKGGIEAAALDEVVEQEGLKSSDALRKQLQRDE